LNQNSPIINKIVVIVFEYNRDVMYIKKVTINKKKQTSPGYHLKVVIYHVPI